MGVQTGRVDELLRCSYQHDEGADFVYVWGDLDLSSVGGSSGPPSPMPLARVASSIWI